MTDKPATVHAEDILRSGMAERQENHISVYYYHEPSMTTYFLDVSIKNGRWYCRVGYEKLGAKSYFDLPLDARNSYNTAKKGILYLAGWLAEYLTGRDLDRWERKRKDQEEKDYMAFHYGEVQNLLGEG